MDLHSRHAQSVPGIDLRGAVDGLRKEPSPDLYAQIRDLLCGSSEGDSGRDLLDRAEVTDLLDLGDALLARVPAIGMDPVPFEMPSSEDGLRSAVWAWLDLTRRSPFLAMISGTPEAKRWLDQVIAACEKTHFTTGALLHQRASQGPSRIWLRVLRKGSIENLTISDLQQRIEAAAKGLHALIAIPPQGQPVALLAENSLETVIADLACLTTGVVNTTIPADATGDQAAYILEQTEASVLLVGSDRQLEKVLPLLPGLPRLRAVVRLARPGTAGEDGRAVASGDLRSTVASGEVRGSAEAAGPNRVRVLSLAELIAEGEGFSQAELRRRRAAVRLDDTATIMYTSGTTGLPKGILFSHRNLVVKRFARALALPEIGEGDHFLCYLPLFHTFGRWLEMLGSLFWGATYTFMENPSLEAMLDNLARARPTVFISIPKKWIQLWERIRSEVPEDAEPAWVSPVVDRITGGNLRWGLSAAGYLDPAVFRFFHRQGIELMSGFGMTEATGGITMTPPGGYREGTVGQVLPGIELTQGDDGELLIRGPYVMKGYFGPDEAEVDHRVEWLPTGDIVAIDPDGYVTMVDRKKDIYKNVKGQTIAPQRVESLFQSFGEVRQVFLVGDGREYNTLLIFPNREYTPPSLRDMSPEALREYLSNIIVSVNGFLAPFERVVDFALLPRALSLEEEELTPKGTFRRKVVEQHFAELIETMYQARVSRLQAGGVAVQFPQWWLRETGLTLQDVVAEPGAARVPRLGRSLTIEAAGVGRVRVGDLFYVGSGEAVDLEAILRSPELWLGNHELTEFAGPGGMRRTRTRRVDEAEAGPFVEGVARKPELSPPHRERLEDALWREDRSLLTIHLTAVALLTSGEKEGLRLVQYLETLASEDDPLRANLARIALRRAVNHPLREVRSSAFRALLPHGAPEMVGPTMTAFLAVDPGVLNAAGAKALTRRGLPDEVVAAFLAFLGQVHQARESQRRARSVARAAVSEARAAALDEPRTTALLRLLVEYAVEHPGWYKAARAELTRWLLSRETVKLRDFARRGLTRLTEGFRAWLGPDPKVAVDPITGREYGWAQVLRFDPGCRHDDRLRIERAVAEVPLVKEAIFVLSGGARVSLAQIPLGGVRVQPLGTGHGKSVYRMTVQTRQAAFEIALNLVSGVAPEAVESEVLWLIRLSNPDGGRPLVEEIGGYWPGHLLWTEEYVPGETVLALLERLTAPGAEAGDRLVPLWLHLASSAVTAYVEFWNRTGRQLIPGDPSPKNLIVPGHDYQEGSRLISISERLPFQGLGSFLRRLDEGIVRDVGERFPALAGVAGMETLYGAVLDVLGEAEGSQLLESMLDERSAFERELPGGTEPLRAFLDRVRAGGYMPRRLSAAIRRYHRWAEANREATRAARARTLADLWDSYSLGELEDGRPETRLRLFRETVFAGASEALRGELARLIAQARVGGLTFESLLREMSELVRRIELSEEQAYFLARLTYAHLRPTDTADLAVIDQGGTRVSEVVVTLRDQAGRYFRVRHATSPREVWALHSLFHASGIYIRFRPAHLFLVAVDETNKVLGGLAYRAQEPGVVHMEKIVVTPSHRRQGISEELMEEFFRRMRVRGVRAVTTGFYRPQYFRRFHFQVDREHAGLMRILGDEGGEEIAAPATGGDLPAAPHSED